MPLPQASAQRAFYQEPSWQPRAQPTLEDVIGDGFHPKSPKIDISYEAPGYAADRIRPAPAPGVHPRVLVTPDDIADLRARVAQGEAAPKEFQALWQRVRESKSALSALVLEDDALGRSLAAQFMERVASLEPKLDRLDAQPDSVNLWSAERSLIASADPEPPTELWTMLDYDYLHRWLSPAERMRAEKAILRVVEKRYSNFLAEPDHFLINNHKGFGMEFIRLMLLVEGVPGFPQRTFEAAARKCHAMLDWYLSPDGMCFESIKGWLNTSAFVAVARRDGKLLRHGHLLAKMRYFQSVVRWQDGRWQVREEMRASASQVIWLMRFLYPENRAYDFLYGATLTTHPFLTDAKEKWPDPVGIAPELLLLFAGGGRGDDRAGKLADWNSQAAIDSLKLPLTWHDDLRGYLEARNTWRIGDLHLGFVNKQDFYYGGHEGSEANRLVLWKDGVNWLRDEDLLAVKATGLQNMLTIDGRGLAWPPVPGVWLGVNEGPHGVSAAGDATLAYSFGKVMQVHPLSFPSGRLPYYAPFTEANFDATRDLQVAFHPGTVKWNDGYAHTDYGPWSGETRLVEAYKANNPVAYAHRTVHLARGERPYVLLFDDARKPDDDEHFFETSFNLPDDAYVVDAKTTEIQFQNVEPSERRESEFLIATSRTARDPETGKAELRKGDPLLLVRILNRTSSYGYPAPRVQVLPGRPERPFKGYTQLVVPARSRDPQFRILFYPHRFGDPLPVTAWNEDRTAFDVSLPGQKDTYRLATTDAGRTVFDFHRGGATALANTTTPARPVLVVRGERFDPNSVRTTRLEGVTPSYPFTGYAEVRFERPPAPAEIRVTLDGSEPGPTSPLYGAPLRIAKSSVLRARVFDPTWPGERRASAETAARFELRDLPPALDKAPNGSVAGLLVRVYEKATKLWDDRGFFRADRIMLPDLDRETPLITARAPEGPALPQVVPARPITEQAKGFYRFTGWFRALENGVHDFAVDSCGPVLLVVGGQDATAQTGVFHQQQAVRRGSVVLGRGWHSFELIVTDPLFWNLSTTGLMPLSLEARDPSSSTYERLPAERFAAQVPASASPFEPAPLWKTARQSPGDVVPGAVRAAYEREGRNRETDYLDIDGLTPRRREPVSVIEANDNPAQIVSYDAWFEAPTDGIYRFELPARRERNAGLGEYRSAYQSQLRVDEEVVVQRGVAGRATTGRIGLRAGWHTISLRLGSSPATATVTYPDGSTLPLDGALLRRPAHVPPMPAEGPVARLDFGAWNGATGIVPLEERCRVWLSTFASKAVVDGRAALVSSPPPVASGPGGVDINMTRGAGRIPLKLHHLRLRDPEFTVAFWFRSETAQGRLVGKEGLTAFGKSYKTISMRLENGQLRAMPNSLGGGKVSAGRWHHAVLSATPMRLALYLDGQLVDAGPGAPGLRTDALDFLADHPAALADVALYNRELSAEEVARLATAAK